MSVDVNIALAIVLTGARVAVITVSPLPLLHKALAIVVSIGAMQATPRVLACSGR